MLNCKVLKQSSDHNTLRGNVHYHWASRGTWWKINFFVIFFPEIAYGKPRNVVWFLLDIFFLTHQKNQKSVTVPRLVKNTQNSVTSTLSKTWAWKFIFEEFTSLLRPIILLWVNFQGHDEPLKITKIRFLKILNHAHIFNRQIRYPVKHQNT